MSQRRTQENAGALVAVQCLPQRDYVPFVFTNQHAYPRTAEYFSESIHLNRIDWPLLQSRDFKHDSGDPGRKERYQAEELVWKHAPRSVVSAVCRSEFLPGNLLDARAEAVINSVGVMGKRIAVIFKEAVPAKHWRQPSKLEWIVEVFRICGE